MSTRRKRTNSGSRILFSAAILKFGAQTIGFRCSLSSGDCTIQAFSDFHVPEVRNKDRCGNRKIKIWKLASKFQFSIFVKIENWKLKIENWYQIWIFVFLRDWKLKFDVEFQFVFSELNIENWSGFSFFNFVEKRLALEFTHLEVRNKDRCGNQKVKIWKLASEFQFSFFVKIENWKLISNFNFVFLRDWKLKFDVEFQFSFFWKLKIEEHFRFSIF